MDLFKKGNNAVWPVLVISSLVFLIIPTSQVFAMGNAPSTCTNRYDGTITSFIINNGTQTFDAIQNPGVTFDVSRAASYGVTFVIHTNPMSSQNNTNPGTTWYDHTAFNFGDGVCVPDQTTTSIGPNQDVTVIDNFSSQCAGCVGTQSVQFATYGTLANPVTYNVHWIDAQPVTSQLQVNSQDNNGNSLSGFFTTLSQNGNQIATGFTPSSFTLNNGQTYTISVSNFGKYQFDHWSDTGSSSIARDISITSDSIITAVYKTVPQPPTGLTATGKLLQINLSWNAPSDNGGASITGYMIERSDDGGSTWSTLVSNTSDTNTTYSDTDVHLLTTYTYRVSAINDVGTSDPSNTASAKTPSVSLTPPSLP